MRTWSELSNAERAIMFYQANTGGGGATASCSGAGQSFNGSDQYLYISDNGDLDIAEATTDFCICGWINAPNRDDDQILFGKTITGAVTYEYGFFITFRTLAFNFRSDEEYTAVVDNITFLQNTDYHLLIRMDLVNNKAYFYINGELQNSGGEDFLGQFSNLSNDYKFIIAGQNDGSGGADLLTSATIKDVRIYHADVTGDIDTIMAGTALGSEVAWWCLSDGNYNDISNNGYNLTASGI